MDMNILLLMLPLTGGNELNFLKFLSAADLDWCAISIPIPVFFSMINQDQMRVLLDLLKHLLDNYITHNKQISFVHKKYAFLQFYTVLLESFLQADFCFV